MTVKTKELNMFDHIEPYEAYLIVNNCKWLRKGVDDIDNINDDGVSAFVSATYSGVQHFGCTDYIDHRNDTNTELKLLVWDDITSRRKHSHQRIHYYKKDRKTPFSKILYWGSNGGYSAKFIN